MKNYWNNNWIRLDFINNWQFKDFMLGLHLEIEKLLYYKKPSKIGFNFVLSLGFWKIDILFKI